MISLLVFAMVSQGGAGLDDRGCGFFGGNSLTLPHNVKLCLGSNCQYWMTYNSSGTQFEFWTSDSDGGGADLKLQWCGDGGTACTFSGLVTGTGGIAVNADNAKLMLGASGATDSYLQFTGANLEIYSSGDIDVLAPLSVGTLEIDPDSGLVSLINMEVTAGAAITTPEGYCFGMASNCMLQIYSESDGAGSADNFSVRMYDSDGNGLYWREFHTAAEKVNPGPTGATALVIGNSRFVYLLDATSEYLYFGFDIHPDWDEASDVVIEVTVALSGGETANDIINGEVICEYSEEHDDIDTNVKTQTRTVNHDIVNDNSQGDQHDVVFLLDYDLLDNVIEIGDHMGCRFRLDSVGGGTDVAGVWMMDINAKYRTKNPAIEIVAFPSEG